MHLINYVCRQYFCFLEPSVHWSAVIHLFLQRAASLPRLPAVNGRRSGRAGSHRQWGWEGRPTPRILVGRPSPPPPPEAWGDVIVLGGDLPPVTVLAFPVQLYPRAPPCPPPGQGFLETSRGDEKDFFCVWQKLSPLANLTLCPGVE